ncbi:hypothetical protein [Paenibacillus amylolyticus]|uniref:hypothetical protein n=1 Tax=Paenibacillus amylolyticus TaxID=1451 RepID=UPI00201DE647|nr:hypothetical protein [Paenibacillus amylolyticus]MCL6661799.1 hypothetical protein [Paenibacillus amylolyticus]
MKRKINLFLILTLIVSVFIPLSSVSAYTGGYANGKDSTIMVPSTYFITQPHHSKVVTPTITDNDEKTGSIIPKELMLMIDLGEDRTIDSYKINSDLKGMRISFYDRSVGYLGEFALTGGDGKLEPLPNEKVIKQVRYITLYTLTGEDININELDFFYSKDPNTSPDPTDPVDPVDPVDPSADRAILVVTMTTGLEKEYDLPISDVNVFLKWYDTRDSGSGPAKFAINKYINNKGPFSKRTDYVIFDKILTFEVSEYTTN